jgi:hypothetical protein
MDADDLPLAVDRVGTVDALAAVADLEHGTLSRENAELGHQMKVSATSDRDVDVAVIRRFVYRFSSNSASMTSSVWPASGPPFGEAEGPFLAAPSPGDAVAA